MGSTVTLLAMEISGVSATRMLADNEISLTLFMALVFMVPSGAVQMGMAVEVVTGRRIMTIATAQAWAACRLVDCLLKILSIIRIMMAHLRDLATMVWGPRQTALRQGITTRVVAGLRLGTEDGGHPAWCQRGGMPPILGTAGTVATDAWTDPLIALSMAHTTGLPFIAIIVMVAALPRGTVLILVARGGDDGGNAAHGVTAHSSAHTTTRRDVHLFLDTTGTCTGSIADLGRARVGDLAHPRHSSGISVRSWIWI